VDQQFRVGATPSMLIMELFAANWLFILLSGVVLSVLMLFISHSFAGPLYRFEAVFKNFNARDLNQTIHLRDKDIGQDLAAEVNLFSSLYSSDLQRLQQLSAVLAEEIKPELSIVAQQAQNEINKILSSYQLKVKV
jgi:methyl-accepting chemotaxis protein